MAMNQVQGGRWDELLRRLFATKEKTIAPSIAPELLPVVEVQKHDPELYFLKGEYLASCATSVAASPGNRGFVQLTMPTLTQSAASIVIVEQVYTFAQVDTVFQLSWEDNLGGSGVGSGFRDGRRGRTVGVATTIPTFTTGAQAAAGTNVIARAFQDAGGGGYGLFDMPVICPPGTPYLTLINENTNAVFWASFHFRQKTVELSELGDQ